MSTTNSAATIEQNHRIGLPIFKKLFEMNSKELKIKLSQICGNLVPDHVFDGHAVVIKVSMNDEPYSIEVFAYDSLLISPFGINFNPEHSSGKTVVEFNEFFKL